VIPPRRHWLAEGATGYRRGVLLWIVPSWAFWVVIVAACLYGAAVWLLLVRVRRRGQRMTATEIRRMGVGGSLVALAAGVVTGGGLVSGWFFALGTLGLVNAIAFAILRRRMARKGGADGSFASCYLISRSRKPSASRGSGARSNPHDKAALARPTYSLPR